MPHMNTFAKSTRIAEKFRSSKNLKTDAIFARNQRAANEAVEGSLYVYKEIGGWFDGITAESVRDALEALKGVDVLNVFINSPGGDVFEAKAIYAQIMRFSAKKVVTIDGLAASAASFIAMAGDEIKAAPESTFMIHDAWGIAFGNAKDMRERADLLDMLSDDIAAIYARKTGKDVGVMRDMMKSESWMTASKALDEGFVDEVIKYDDDEDTNDKASASRFVKLIENSVNFVTSVEGQTLERRAQNLQEQTQKMMKNRASAKR